MNEDSQDLEVVSCEKPEDGLGLDLHWTFCRGWPSAWNSRSCGKYYLLLPFHPFNVAGSFCLADGRTLCEVVPGGAECESHKLGHHFHCSFCWYCLCCQVFLRIQSYDVGICHAMSFFFLRATLRQQHWRMPNAKRPRVPRNWKSQRPKSVHQHTHT